VDSYRDLLTSAVDTHLSNVSNRLNVVMKQLAVIATVFLPLSFLTGFFGRTRLARGSPDEPRGLRRLRHRDRGGGLRPADDALSRKRHWLSS